MLSSQARVIAVDIPIDPPGLGVRATDAGARAFVGGSRASSVFPTPPRAALEARTFAEANEIARTITGKGISQQAFALGRKILEVHALAEVDERVIEMHPEVSFRELAGEPVLESKHTAAGLARRRELLEAAGVVLPGAVPGVPEADLLDAAAGAWTAARYAEGKAQALPADHAGTARGDLALANRLGVAQRADVHARQHHRPADDERCPDRLVVDPRGEHDGDQGNEDEGVGGPRRTPQPHDDEVEHEDRPGAEHDHVCQREPGRALLGEDK